MLDVIYLDVESINNPDKCKTGWATSGLGVGVAVIYEVLTDRVSIYGENDVDALRERIIRAKVIAGFNIWAFDLPLVFALDRKDWEQRLDGECIGRHRIAREIIGSSLVLDARRLLLAGMGKSPNGGSVGGTNLDDIARSTLGRAAFGAKMLNSKDLPDMLARGDWSGVASECSRHVYLERDLLRFMLRHGYAIAGVDTQRVEIAADPELWASGLDAKLIAAVWNAPQLF